MFFFLKLPHDFYLSVTSRQKRQVNYDLPHSVKHGIYNAFASYLRR